MLCFFAEWVRPASRVRATFWPDCLSIHLSIEGEALTLTQSWSPNPRPSPSHIHTLFQFWWSSSLSLTFCHRRLWPCRGCCWLGLAGGVGDVTKSKSDCDWDWELETHGVHVSDNGAEWIKNTKMKINHHQRRMSNSPLDCAGHRGGGLESESGHVRPRLRRRRQRRRGHGPGRGRRHGC